MSYSPNVITLLERNWYEKAGINRVVNLQLKRLIWQNISRGLLVKISKGLTNLTIWAIPGLACHLKIPCD